MGTMTIEQFGQEVKKKYPQYQDVPDAELGQQVIEKYPQYQRALSVDKPSSVSPEEESKKKPNILQGLAKPFLRTATNVLNVAEGASKLATGKPLAGVATRSRDFGFLGKDIRPVGVSDEGQLKDVGGFAKDVIGTGAEIASYAAPAGVLGKAAPLASKVASGLKAGATAGSLGAFGQGLQQDQSFGKTLGQTALGATLGGVTGGVLPAVGAVAGKTVKTIGNLGAEVLGRTTGAGEAAIKEAYSNPAVVKFARQAGKEGPEGLMTQALEDAQKGLKQLKKTRGGEYTADLAKIKLNKSQLDDIIFDARETARDLLSSTGVKIKEGKLLNTLDFADSTIERGQGTVQKSFNDVMRWTDVTPAGLDKLQKKLSQHLDEIPVTERGGAFNFVLELKNAVSNKLKANVPGYQQMTSKYHEASDLIDEIQRALSLKDTAAKDTAVRKLMSTMRQNNELRKAMLEVLGKAGGSDISGKIAGATLAPSVPRGLTGALAPTTTTLGGVTAFLNPVTIPYMLFYLASASPRLVAEAVALLGKVKGPTIPFVIRKQLQNLLIQAEREAATNQNDD